jgi:hypothetical protein
MGPKKRVVKPAKGPGPELANHVFGPEEGAAIAKAFAASLQVMTETCTMCGTKAEPEKPFVWALVAVVTPKNAINPGAVYVVQLKDLKGGQNVTLDLGDDSLGKDRVRNYFSSLYIIHV